MTTHPVTAASARPEPELLLLAGPDAILSQEARGGRALVESSLMPKERHGSDAEWEALGFTFGKDVDDLFQECTLPTGWTRKSMSDPRGSYVLDERGVERVSVFYKAAFYDRKASASLVNVGSQVGMHAVYGDEDVAVVQHLDQLTEHEKAGAVEFLRYYLGDCQRSPRIYGDREDRARDALLTLGHPDAEPLFPRAVTSHGRGAGSSRYESGDGRG